MSEQLNIGRSLSMVCNILLGHLPGVATPEGGYPVDVQLIWPGGPVRSSVILEEAHLLSYHIKLPFK